MGLFDFLFGSDESSFDVEYFRSMSEDRRHRASGSGNWTSREDWDCGDYDSDGMSGWDSYDDNDLRETSNCIDEVKHITRLRPV